MTKVYVVTHTVGGHGYSPYTSVSRVFDSEAKAIAFINGRSDYEYDEYEVE